MPEIILRPNESTNVHVKYLYDRCVGVQKADIWMIHSILIGDRFYPPTNKTLLEFLRESFPQINHLQEILCAATYYMLQLTRSLQAQNATMQYQFGDRIKHVWCSYADVFIGTQKLTWPSLLYYSNFIKVGEGITRESYKPLLQITDKPEETAFIRNILMVEIGAYVKQRDQTINEDEYQTALNLLTVEDFNAFYREPINFMIARIPKDFLHQHLVDLSPSFISEDLNNKFAEPLSKFLFV